MIIFYKFIFYVNVSILRPALISNLDVKQAIMTGVAFVAPVAQILPFDVACFSMLAVEPDADGHGDTSHPIEIGVAEQFKSDTVYMSCSVATFNDNICA